MLRKLVFSFDLKALTLNPSPAGRGTLLKSTLNPPLLFLGEGAGG